jgi:Zn-dependent membrane protease YugP
MPTVIRQKIVPVTNFASRLIFPVIIAGILLMSISPFGIGYYVMIIGIALYSLITIFHLVTLPTEYDASNRALKEIQAIGVYDSGAISGAKKVLSAAALTYVAALASSLITLLRLIMSLRRRR